MRLLKKLPPTFSFMTTIIGRVGKKTSKIVIAGMNSYIDFLMDISGVSHTSPGVCRGSSFSSFSIFSLFPDNSDLL